MTTDTPRSPLVTATLWGDAGLLAGAAAGIVLALPFYPQDPQGWDELGWWILALLAAAALGLIAGAAAIATGLRRSGSTKAVVTGLVFVPAALLLGAVSGGVGALAAPAVSTWLVRGWGGWTGGGWSRGGWPQRALVAAVVVTGATWWTVGSAGDRFGGLVHGEVLVWVACLPVIVAVPILLLRRSLPPAAIAAGIVVAAALAGLAVPSAVEHVPPAPERLKELAAGIDPPAGQRVVETVVGKGEEDIGEPGLLPVVVLVSAPVGEPAPPVPPALRPGSDGLLPRGAGSGAEIGWPWTPAAEAWERRLRAEGWEVDEFSDSDSGSYWLPDPAADVVDAAGRPRFAHGVWVRATVVPAGGGALVVLSVRP